ncbi:MAG: TIGR04053 family radical SAM/SPASM domain-containing protein [Lysobacterales bacterium]
MIEADFDQAPFTIAWEVTRACAYRCIHCRANAQHQRDSRELSTSEAKQLIDRFRAFGSPILVFTGGDPMMRPDLFELIAYATGKGLRCSLTPTATALPTAERLRLAQAAGIRRIALSLDAPKPEVHDAFRQVPGSWARTLAIAHAAQSIGLAAQINTTVARHNQHLLPEMVQFLKEVGAVQWSLFFLVPTGRAQAINMISAADHERLFHWLYDLAQTAPFDIKTTAAPMYRRVVIERHRAVAQSAARSRHEGQTSGETVHGAGFQYADGLNRPVKGVNDGRGFLFVSHTGDIMPSGFLPIPVENVRNADIVDVYRNDSTFKALRDPAQLKGKCSRCEYRVVCGGQRGRAYAVTGDYLESDPACIYQPMERGENNA